MVEVRLFATFRDNREKIYFLDTKEYKKAKDVLEYLKIPIEDVAILLYNGRHNNEEVELKDGDILALFPPVGGG